MIAVNGRPVLADVDGDGDEDLVVGATNGFLRYFEKDANGYTEKIGDGVNPLHGISVYWGILLPPFADINGDGKLDLVLGRNSGRLEYYQKNASGIKYTHKTGAANPFNSFDVGGYSTPVFVNLTGDTQLDLVVGSTEWKDPPLF